MYTETTHKCTIHRSMYEVKSRETQNEQLPVESSQEHFCTYHSSGKNPLSRGQGRTMARYNYFSPFYRGVITDDVGESCNRCSNTVGTLVSLDFTKSGKISVFWNL